MSEEQVALTALGGAVRVPERNEGLVDGIAGRIFNAVVPGLGTLATSAKDVERDHKEGIEQLSDRDFAGFEHREVTLSNGDTVEVWIDASDVANGDRVRSYTEGGPDGGNEREMSYADSMALKELEDIVKAMEKKAHMEVYNQNPSHDGEIYNNALRGAIDGIARDNGIELQQDASLEIDGDFDLRGSALAGNMDLIQQASAAGVAIDPNLIPVDKGPAQPAPTQSFTV